MNKTLLTLKYRKIARKLFGYFLRGTVLVLPISLTIYLIFWVVRGIDEIITSNFEFMPSGTGFVIIVIGLTLIGMFGSSILWTPFQSIFKLFVEKTPGIKQVYNPIKDFFEGLVGDKKKFSNAVRIKVNDNPEIWVLGFVTQQDVDFLDMEGYVTVYCPKSYGILGELMIVKKENVISIDKKMNSSEVMKFVLSGGLASAADDDTNN